MHVFCIVWAVVSALAFLYAMYDDADTRSAFALMLVVVVCCIFWPVVLVALAVRKMPHEKISSKIVNEKLAPKLVK